jgi:hypothetical protein
MCYRRPFCNLFNKVSEVWAINGFLAFGDYFSHPKPKTLPKRESSIMYSIQHAALALLCQHHRVPLYKPFCRKKKKVYLILLAVLCDLGLFPLAVIFFCRSTCLSGQTGGGQWRRQTVQLGQNFKGSQTKVTAAKKCSKITLGQAQGDDYLLFKCLPLYVIALAVSLCPQNLFCPSAGSGRYRRMPVCRPGLACRPSSNRFDYTSVTTHEIQL